MHVNTHLKQTLFASLLSLSVAMLPSHAQFIDSFSTNTSADYDAFATFLASGATAQVYAENGSHQFQPTVNKSSTTYFIRNTGEFLTDTISPTFKQSVSIDIDGVAANAAAGIGFSTSVNSAVNAFEFGIISNPSSTTAGKIDPFGLTGVPATALTFNFSLGPVTAKITRTGDTTFTYALSGAGLTNGPFSGSFTDSAVSGKNLFFGMETYSSANTSLEIEDNLTFVPEPGPLTLMAIGGGALIMALRFRRLMS